MGHSVNQSKSYHFIDIKCFLVGHLDAEVARTCRMSYKDPDLSSTACVILALTVGMLNRFSFECNLANDARKTIPGGTYRSYITGSLPAER